MSSPLKSELTREEYLAFERRSYEKHEYVDGRLFAMGGASSQHNQIVVNLGGEIRAQFKNTPCKVYTSDMRVKFGTPSRYAYPDVVGLYESEQFEDAELDTLLNPNLIVEVLSGSTEAYDRGRKFEDYRGIRTLAEYVLVAQDRPHVEQFIKQPSGQWLLIETNGLESFMELQSVGCRLSLAEVYDKVDLGPTASPAR